MVKGKSYLESAGVEIDFGRLDTIQRLREEAVLMNGIVHELRLGCASLSSEEFFDFFFKVYLY